jgi:imidazole glycerol-phosphate synthase subunit HisH
LLVYVDLPASNIGSLLRAFRLVGVTPAPVRAPADLASATAILLPGVGAFGYAKAWLDQHGLSDAIRAKVAGGTPILGICLGMQLLAEYSDEGGGHAGLGLIPGHVRLLASEDVEYRVPNIGWCDVRILRNGALFPTDKVRTLYHVHSYYLDGVAPEHVTGVIEFAGSEVAVAVESGNVFGVQFHPEKSQNEGLEVIAAFLTRCGLAPVPAGVH